MTEETIFAAALERRTAHERRTFLDEACAGNAELRAAVEELLKADSDAGSFLKRPPVGLEATVVSEVSSRDTPASGTWAAQLSFLKPCNKPDRLGQLDVYEIIEVVGHGGMGAVLRAFDTKLSRVVAVKVMSPTLAANPTAVRRFLREATTAAAVHHDHVVTIHAVDDAHRPPYIVMQFVEGQTLQQKIDREGALQLKHILRIGSQAAAGLAAAHKLGLIHRDVKPANILLENGVERVKITDFGLARAADDVQMTQTGIIAGTPQYMSPEQARGEPIDAKSDLFSLGSVLYTMCTGRPAFRADHPVAVLRRVCDDTPRPIREVNPEIPDWLEAIVNKLLAKDPAQRFQSAAEVAELLSQHLAHVQNPALAPLPAPIQFAQQKSAPDAPFTAESVRDQFRILAGAWWMGFPLAVLGELFGVPALSAFGVPAIIVATVFWLILLYRHWSLLQGHGARTTPGKAVGFGFIPIYWFYWWYVAYVGLAEDNNRYLDKIGVKSVRMSYELALIYYILNLLLNTIGLVPAIGAIVMVPFAIIGFILALQQRDCILAILHQRGSQIAPPVEPHKSAGRGAFDQQPVAAALTIVLYVAGVSIAASVLMVVAYLAFSRSAVVPNPPVSTLSRPGFTFDYPSTWTVNKKDKFYDPDHLFTIDASYGAMIMFVIADAELDPAETLETNAQAQSKKISNPVRTEFDRWGKYIGRGVELRGNSLGLLPVTSRLFVFSADGKTITVIEYWPDDEASQLSAGFQTIANSFRVLPERKEDTQTKELAHQPPADASPAAFARYHHARLQGTWAAISGEGGGEPISGSELTNLRLVFDGDHVTATGPGPKGGGDGTFELDTAATPRRIKITRSEGQNRFAVMDGIYDLDGDRLKICMGEPEDKVTEFKSRPGTHILLAEFVRVVAAPGTIVLPALPDPNSTSGKRPKSIYELNIPGLTKITAPLPQPVDLAAWGTFVDPRGDCKLKREASRITITVPGSIPHNLLPGDRYNFDAPRLMSEMNGDFLAQVIVPPYPRPLDGSAARGNVSYRSVGFVVWVDEKNLLRFERNGWGEQRAGAPFLHVEWHVDGQYRGDETEFLPDQPDGPTHLQLERRGSELHLAWSRDGKSWKPWRIIRDMNLPPRVSLGLAVQNSTNAEYSAVFERLAIDLKAPRATAGSSSSAPTDNHNDWVPLFNGRDLTGWKTLPEQPGDWKVENGVLQGQGGLSHLFSEKTYDDFHLRVEVNLVKGDGGIRFRTELGLSNVSRITGLKYPAGYEGEIIDPKSNHAPGNTGSIRPMAIVNEDLAPLGEWFTFEIIARGNHFTTKINGTVVADCDDPDRRFARGHVALSCGGSGLQTIVRYRKVELQELGASSGANSGSSSSAFSNSASITEGK